MHDTTVDKDKMEGKEKIGDSGGDKASTHGEQTSATVDVAKVKNDEHAGGAGSST